MEEKGRREQVTRSAGVRIIEGKGGIVGSVTSQALRGVPSEAKTPLIIEGGLDPSWLNPQAAK